MGVGDSTNHLACLNCGCVVHWTTFQCHVCGQNPREREKPPSGPVPPQDFMLQNIERRQYPRYDFQGKVVLNRIFMGELIDLSQQGASLRTPLHLFHNELVHLHFTIKGIPIQVRARVIHVRQGVLDDRFTLGVCFESIAKDHRDILKHHLERIAAGRPRHSCYA